MGFRWNGKHSSEFGLLVEIVSLPITPTPKKSFEQLPAKDGYVDFSKFNNNRRVHYEPRQWAYRCAIEEMPGEKLTERINKIAAWLSQSAGYLEADVCPGVRWEANITNSIDLNFVVRNLRAFNIYFQSQAFGEGFDSISQTFTLPGTVLVENLGTWFVRPEVILNGTVDANATIGDFPIPKQGAVEDYTIVAPELAPGENNIVINNFDGTAVFEFTPRYLWGIV